MGIWDNIADRYFAKDGSGKLVFLPCGRSKPSYYVDSTDESKIKSLVKMYVVAVALISLTGMMAVIGFTDSLLSDERGASLAHQLKFGAHSRSVHVERLREGIAQHLRFCNPSLS